MKEGLLAAIVWLQHLLKASKQSGLNPIGAIHASLRSDNSFASRQQSQHS